MNREAAGDAQGRAEQRGRMPDHRALLAARLESGDDYLSHGHVTPVAFARDTSIGPGGNVMNAVIGLISNTVSARRHIGGPPGSLARGLPRDAEQSFLVLGRRYLSWWVVSSARSSDFVLSHRLARKHVASIRELKRVLGGRLIRLTFTDGSFFDYRTVDAIVDERFFAELGTYGLRSPTA
ncbi:hypothetical protein [Zhihengliuella sp. ISTPL4]|uniref:hypothetical protein n=1 Tax=Zhihengliuella sp. ISTPL4 TaxID=2058657 RepID=UPI000C7D6BEF|nr:hypothetical protein [Zhihengliuella sp. ISTPL4]